MNNEYWLGAFSFPNSSTVCLLVDFLTLLCRWDDRGAAEGHCAWIEPGCLVLCCAWGFQHGAESHPWELEVRGSSAKGARVGSGVLLQAHNHAQTLAGPEGTDIRVTIDRRIFPFYI